MFEGTKVTMGGEEWTIPALSFRQVRELLPRLQQVNSPGFEDPMGMVIDVVAMAMSRNYPDITPEKVGDMIDLRNAGQIFKVVMGQSGITESAPGELVPGKE